MALIQASFHIEEEEGKLSLLQRPKEEEDEEEGGEEENKLSLLPKPKEEEGEDDGKLSLFQNPKGEERETAGDGFSGRRPRIEEEEEVGEEFKRRRRIEEADEEEEEEGGNKKPKGNVGTCDWSSEAVSALLDSYSIKFSLGKGFLRGKDWEEVLTHVNNNTFDSSIKKTMKQCKDKVDSLKRRYKVEKRKAVNGSRVTWPFFNQIDHMMASVLRQGKLFDPRQEKLLEPFDSRQGQLFDPRQRKLFEPSESRQEKMFEPHEPRQKKIFEPCDSRKGSLFETCDSRQGKLYEPCDSLQGNIFENSDSMQGKLFEPCDSMQGKLFETCESRQGKLFESYDSRQGQFFESRFSNGFGYDPLAHSHRNALQTGKSTPEEDILEGGVKHCNLMRNTALAVVENSYDSAKPLQMQSSGVHQKSETKKRKIALNTSKMPELEDVVTRFSDVFARIEIAKKQIFNKMKREMAKIHKMKKKHKPSISNYRNSG